MSIIDELLGSNGSQESGSINESDNWTSVDTAPTIEFGTGQVLGFSTANVDSDGGDGDHSASATEFSLLDGIGLGVSVPIDTDFQNSSASADYSDSGSNGGGLLSGLL